MLSHMFMYNPAFVKKVMQAREERPVYQFKDKKSFLQLLKNWACTAVIILADTKKSSFVKTTEENGAGRNSATAE